MAMPNPPQPVCKAILLCDRVVHEVGTGKINLIGVDTNFIVDETLTTRHSEVFAEITAAEGRYDITIEILDATNASVIARAEGRGIEISDSTMFNSVVLPIPPHRLQNDGLHEIVILANGREIERRPFGVIRNTGDAHVDSGRA